MKSYVESRVLVSAGCKLAVIITMIMVMVVVVMEVLVLVVIGVGDDCGDGIVIVGGNDDGGDGEHPIFLTECLWGIGLMGTVQVGYPSFVVGSFPRKWFWWRKYFTMCVGVGSVVASQWSAMVLSRAHG